MLLSVCCVELLDDAFGVVNGCPAREATEMVATTSTNSSEAAAGLFAILRLVIEFLMCSSSQLKF